MDCNSVLTNPDFLQALPFLFEQGQRVKILVDVQGNVEYVNQAFVMQTGFAQEEVVGKNLSAFQSGRHPLLFPPIELWETIARDEKCQGGSSVEKETGTFRWPLHRILPIKDASGTTKHFLAILEDGAVQERAVAACNERLVFEELLSTLSAQFVNLTPDQVDDAIQGALQKILEFFGVDRCGLLQILHDKQAWRITHVAISENSPPVPVGVDLPVSSHPWAYDMLVGKGQPVVFSNLEELPPEAAPDKQVYREMNVSSLLDIPITNGELVTHVIALNTVNFECVWPQELLPRLRLLGDIFVNALNRRNADQALRVSEERLTLAASAAEAGLWILNMETGQIWATQICRELLDLSKTGDLTWEKFLKVIHPEDRSGVEVMKRKALETGKVERIEYRILCPDGSHRWIASRGKSSGSAQGQPASLMGVSIDITRNKALEGLVKEQFAEINKLKLQLEQENSYLRDEVKAERGLGAIVGSSDVLHYVMFRARQVAPTDATVLILGETGTGKSLVANEIHEMSQRNKKSLITVNCAGLPGNLIESELFGREKGAFTGAHARQLGRFELADGGTIFLDEIGEMPLSLQVKLLRVLQDGEFERLGSSRTLKVDVRVIAATSRDLKADIAAGRFREDLYYRLHVFPLSIPPLRLRPDDIPQLAEYFIERYAKKFSKRFKTIAKGTMPRLIAYSWPGNVRELEHLIERGVITSDGLEFRLADSLEEDMVSTPEVIPSAGFDAVARTHILQVLEKTNWKIEGKGGAAETLGLHPSTLRFRLKKLGVKRF